MDLTQGTEEQKNNRAKKMMLWFGIASLIMGFAGWTSAYIVSSKRTDWIADLDLPQAFLWSTGIIILSSLTYILAKLAVKKGNQKQGTLFLLATLGLGIPGRSDASMGSSFRIVCQGNAQRPEAYIGGTQEK